MYFRNEYYFLSNMYPCEIKYGSKTFTCVESAFQACKCPSRVNEFTNLDGYKAKKLGRIVSLADDWETKKIGYMYTILKIKFSNSILRDKLVNITEPIIEENNWGDTYWGACNGIGNNMLGKLLTKIREELL